MTIPEYRRPKDTQGNPEGSIVELVRAFPGEPLRVLLRT